MSDESCGEVLDDRLAPDRRALNDGEESGRRPASVEDGGRPRLWRALVILDGVDAVAGTCVGGMYRGRVRKDWATS